MIKRMAIIIHNTILEDRLAKVGKDQAVPLKKTTLANAIVDRVVNASTVEEIVNFVKSIRPDIRTESQPVIAA